MEKEVLYLLIIFAGVLAGFINTLAGSGSIITLPLLEMLGLPLQIANGTNRIAIFLQNVMGVSQFHNKKLLDTRGLKFLSLPSIFGWALGSFMAARIDPALFKNIFAYILVILLILILLKPNKWLIGEILEMKSAPKFSQLLLFFGVGIYGGFIQAGVGIFLLSALVLNIGYDLVRANAVKVGIVLVSTAFALIIFIANGMVDFTAGFILAIGNVTGAWLGTKVASTQGPKWIRRLLIAIILFSILKMFGIINL